LVEKLGFVFGGKTIFGGKPIPETELGASISRYLEDPSGSHQSVARCTPRHLICTADNAPS